MAKYFPNKLAAFKYLLSFGNLDILFVIHLIFASSEISTIFNFFAKAIQVRVEVKCTGYFQTWRTDDKVSQNRYYSIKPAHDKVKNTFERQNDIYVFCLLLGNTREEANPLNLNNWEFYIVPTSVINKECQEANTIRLG